MELRRSEIRRFVDIIDKIRSSKVVSLKFAASLYKLKKKVDVEIEFIASELPKLISDEYREFEMRRESILRKYSSNIDQESGRYTIPPEKINDMTAEMEELTKSFTEEQLINIKNTESDIRSFMEEKVNIDVEPIKLDMIPENVLTYQDLEFLLDIGAVVE